jgi:hypothetical protein
MKAEYSSQEGDKNMAWIVIASIAIGVLFTIGNGIGVAIAILIAFVAFLATIGFCQLHNLVKNKAECKKVARESYDQGLITGYRHKLLFDLSEMPEPRAIPKTNARIIWDRLNKPLHFGRPNLAFGSSVEQQHESSVDLKEIPQTSTIQEGLIKVSSSSFSHSPKRGTTTN